MMMALSTCATSFYPRPGTSPFGKKVKAKVTADAGDVPIAILKDLLMRTLRAQLGTCLPPAHRRSPLIPPKYARRVLHRQEGKFPNLLQGTPL
jgi:hypothetical protein